ncbi:MAG: tetratricopeptide repeat protein [Verrucomicrobiales bacterium]|nr:tetratricopeptide repeat protein [Verrucomicrobiales bacterium]
MNFTARVHIATVSFLWAVGVPAAEAPVGASAEVTYHGQISSVLRSHCVSCHRPGQSGPFPLMTYEDARKHAKDMVDVTSRRYMPPWLPEPGTHPFRGARRLSEDEIALFRRWLDAGMPRGNPAAEPPAPVWSNDWQMGTPDLVLKLAEPFTVPAEGRDVYRSFVLPTGLDQRRHVAAWELRPNSRAAHHAFVHVDRSGEARRRDAQDPESGFPGMDTPPGVESPNGHFASWQPGAAPARNPPGLPWTLEPGADLMLQFHLQPTGRPERFQPEIGLYFTDQAPTNRPIKLGLVDYAFEIPAGATNVTARDEFVLPADADLLGVLPHTHYLGHRVEGRAWLPDGTVESLLTIPDWDFNWQGAYLYEKPVFLPAGTRITMAITFDNSTNNIRNPFHPPRTTRFGPNTTDEMAELWLQLLPRTEAGVAAFDRVALERTVRDNTAYYQQRLRINPNDAAALVQLGRTVLAQKRPADAEAYFRQAARLAPQMDDAQYYLGLACRLQNRPAEAAAAFRRALELNPKHARANGNLGLMHLGAGRLDEAARYLQVAIDLDATDVLARNAMARILLQQGKPADAAVLYRRVLELDPRNAEARSGLNSMGKTP